MKTIQCTISGTDFNGYVWQNVFALNTVDPPGEISAFLALITALMQTNLETPLTDAMSDQCTIFDYGARIISSPSSYTFHKSANAPGNRTDPMDTGAIAGRIVWFPENGSQVGHQYISGVCQGDFENDYIGSVYLPLLTDVKNAFLMFNSTDPDTSAQLVIYSKKTSSTVDVNTGAAMYKAGILSKRIRA